MKNSKLLEMPFHNLLSKKFKTSKAVAELYVEILRLLSRRIVPTIEKDRNPIGFYVNFMKPMNFGRNRVVDQHSDP